MNSKLLHQASRVGDFVTVKDLVKQKWKINETDGLGRTPLHESIYSLSLNTVKLLIQSGSDVSIQDIYGMTPLSLCFYNIASTNSSTKIDKGLKICDYLVSKGASLLEGDKYANTIIHVIAAKVNNANLPIILNKICFYINHNVPIVSSPYVDLFMDYINTNKGCNIPKLLLFVPGWGLLTPLHLMCNNNNIITLNSCKQILSEDRLLNNYCCSPVDAYGWTPLHYACKYNHTEVIKILLQFGCDISTIDYLSRSPLDITLSYGHKQTIRELINSLPLNDTNNTISNAMTRTRYVIGKLLMCGSIAICIIAMAEFMLRLFWLVDIGVPAVYIAASILYPIILRLPFILLLSDNIKRSIVKMLSVLFFKSGNFSITRTTTTKSIQQSDIKVLKKYIMQEYFNRITSLNYVNSKLANVDHKIPIRADVREEWNIYQATIGHTYGNDQSVFICAFLWWVQQHQNIEQIINSNPVDNNLTTKHPISNKTLKQNLIESKIISIGSHNSSKNSHYTAVIYSPSSESVYEHELNYLSSAEDLNKDTLSSDPINFNNKSKMKKKHLVLKSFKHKINSIDGKIPCSANSRIAETEREFAIKRKRSFTVQPLNNKFSLSYIESGSKQLMNKSEIIISEYVIKPNQYGDNADESYSNDENTYLTDSNSFDENSCVNEKNDNVATSNAYKYKPKTNFTYEGNYDEPHTVSLKTTRKHNVVYDEPDLILHKKPMSTKEEQKSLKHNKGKAVCDAKFNKIKNSTQSHGQTYINVDIKQDRNFTNNSGVITDHNKDLANNESAKNYNHKYDQGNDSTLLNIAKKQNLNERMNNNVDQTDIDKTAYKSLQSVSTIDFENEGAFPNQLITPELKQYTIIKNQANASVAQINDYSLATENTFDYCSKFNLAKLPLPGTPAQNSITVIQNPILTISAMNAVRSGKIDQLYLTWKKEFERLTVYHKEIPHVFFDQNCAVYKFSKEQTTSSLEEKADIFTAEGDKMHEKSHTKNKKSIDTNEIIKLLNKAFFSRNVGKSNEKLKLAYAAVFSNCDSTIEDECEYCFKLIKCESLLHNPHAQDYPPFIDLDLKYKIESIKQPYNANKHIHLESTEFAMTSKQIYKTINNLFKHVLTTLVLDAITIIALANMFKSNPLNLPQYYTAIYFLYLLIGIVSVLQLYYAYSIDTYKKYEQTRINQLWSQYLSNDCATHTVLS